MTDDSQLEITAARERLREAEAKFDRQQRRYARLALESDIGAAPAKATMLELEAALEAAREALRKLEEPPGA